MRGLIEQMNRGSETFTWAGKLLLYFGTLCGPAITLAALAENRLLCDPLNSRQARTPASLKLAQAPGPLPPAAERFQNRDEPQAQAPVPEQTPGGIENPYRWYAAPPVTPLRPLTPVPMVTPHL